MKAGAAGACLLGEVGLQHKSKAQLPSGETQRGQKNVPEGSAGWAGDC